MPPYASVAYLEECLHASMAYLRNASIPPYASVAYLEECLHGEVKSREFLCFGIGRLQNRKKTLQPRS